MKKLRGILSLVIALSVMMVPMTFTASADTTTDLESMTVYAVNAAGEKTEVSIDFNSTTYEYDLIVMADTESIEIEAVPADSTSTSYIDKDGINTKMDVGTNFTQVVVKSATGATNTYTLNTTRLTEEEQATYVAPETEANEDETESTEAEKSDDDATVTVGKKEFKIANTFEDGNIPEGFIKSTSEYAGVEYDCIIGEQKALTAFYLYNDTSEGFYIYDADKDEFYAMNNIQIKSRMYTIVNPEKEDGFLKNYSKKKVNIVDTEVKAWALNADEGMYLVYAMNWDGDTYLYCYDDNEKCFQRYIVQDDANTQVEAADKAYKNLQNKHNSLVNKYNIILKIMCGLIIIIIILIFVIINLGIKSKEKKIKKNEQSEDSESDEDINEKSDDEVEKDVKEEVVEGKDEQDIVEDIEEIEVPKNKLFGKRVISDRGYGDEPTFGSEAESKEGFYGGEIEEEDDIFIDITEDEPKEITEEDIEKKTAEVQQEAEEDLKATLKSMLPDEDDDDEEEDNDEDFEFIDLN